jgi:SSS family solute:Na+ symporter
MVLAAVYGLFLLYVIFRLLRRPARDQVDFLVAGRRLTLPVFVASLVSTWYGGILGIGEYSWRHGVSNWLVFGVPYYLYAAVFAIAIAGRARRSRMLTVPDQLERTCGRPAALVGAVVLFVMTAPAAYVLMLGVLMQLATGWPLWVGVVLGTAMSTVYIFRGGMRAIVLTDKVQFVLMYVAFLVLVPACVVKFGGWSWLRAHLPPGHLAWDGGLGWQAIAVWYVIAMSTLVEPAFYQRCYSAASEKTARVGIGVAIGFWFVFDLMTTTAGLYARAVLPDLADPVTAFPRLAEAALPPLWQGLFFVGALATIMGTVDSYTFIAAVTLGRDIVTRWRRPAGALLAEADDDGAGSRTAIGWGLVATAVCAVVLALVSQSVVGLWHDLGSVGTPVLLVPLAASHFGRGATTPRARRALAWIMAAAGTAALGWLFVGRLQGGLLLGVEPIFPGLVVSLLGLGVLRPGARDTVQL